MASSQVRIPRSRARAVSILAIAGVVLTLATTAHGSPVFGPKDYLVQPGLPLPAIERFPACQPERGGQLRVENGPGGRPRVTLAVVAQPPPGLHDMFTDRHGAAGAASECPHRTPSLI